MKSLKLSFLLCSLSFISKAQTVTPTVYSNQGDYNVASGGSISWTIGEPVSETYTISTNKTTMGFHQPDISVASLISEQGNETQVLVYPNPVKGILNVNFEGLDNAVYKVEMIDESSKLILRSENEINSNNNAVQLNMEPYAMGVYYLRIYNSTFNKTIKITKTQ